jgi:hypothetical protein
VTDEERKRDVLTDEEVEAARGEPLPPREQMSLIKGAEPVPTPILPDGGEGFSIMPVPTEEV